MLKCICFDIMLKSATEIQHWKIRSKKYLWTGEHFIVAEIRSNYINGITRSLKYMSGHTKVIWWSWSLVQFYLCIFASKTIIIKLSISFKDWIYHIHGFIQKTTRAWSNKFYRSHSLKLEAYIRGLESTPDRQSIQSDGGFAQIACPALCLAGRTCSDS